MNQKRQPLISLRHELHSKAELSGEESETSQMIILELESCNPERIINNVGGHGVVAIFGPTDQKPDKTILFRSELDALPVVEATELDYQSVNRGKMHACGHDGHMTILIGLAREIQKMHVKRLNMALLFQPAEETGEGAMRVLDDDRFQELEIDHGYALHNLPGYDENTVYVKSQSFASASAGVEIIIKGKSSHAAYPEQGINPSETVARLVQKTRDQFREVTVDHPACKYAVTFINMGERAFGMSPGEAQVGFTFRSATDEGLSVCLDWIQNIVKSETDRFPGEISTKVVEPFAATVNSSEGCELVKRVAEQAGFGVKELENPFPWSEDFGRFGEKFPITLFGIGSGSDTAPLHSEKYNFNDAIIPTGVKMLKGIVESYNS